MSHFILKSVGQTAFGCAASLLLLTGTATAQTNSATISFSSQNAIQSTAFSLPDFDSSLGTLQAVTLTLNLSDSATVEVFNLSQSGEDFKNASLSQQNTVTAPGLTLAPSVNAVVAGGTAAPGLNYLSSIAATQTATGTVDSRVFSLWEDQLNGLVNLTFTKGNPTFQGTDLGPNNLFFGGTLDGTANITVEYTYITTNAAPEPNAKFLSMLVALAMGGLAFSRLRFQQS